jgi:hypothetical protein
MIESSKPPPRKPGIARGAWTIAAIFAVGIAVTIGLYLSPRTKSPPVPAGFVEGFPQRAVTIAVVDAEDIGPQPQRVIDAISRVHQHPDVIMLIGIDSALVPPVAEVFGMQASFHPQLYQRVKREDGNEHRGVCILCKQELYAGAPVKTADGRVVGVQTVATIDGRTFRLICLDTPEPFVVNDHPRMCVMISRARGMPSFALDEGKAAAGHWTLTPANFIPDQPPATLFILRPRPTSSPATTQSAESPAATQAAP